MSFWKPVEDPGTRPLRSWVFDIGCASFAVVASLAHFSFGQTAHPASLPLAASLVVAALTALALPLRRVWPGPVFVWTLLAAPILAQWPTHGALFPVALAIALYTVAATMRRAEALAAAVLDGRPRGRRGRPRWHASLGARGLGRGRVRGRGAHRGPVREHPPGLPRRAARPGQPA